MRASTISTAAAAPPMRTIICVLRVTVLAVATLSRGGGEGASTTSTSVMGAETDTTATLSAEEAAAGELISGVSTVVIASIVLAAGGVMRASTFTLAAEMMSVMSAGETPMRLARLLL